MTKLAIVRQKYRPDGGAEKIIARTLKGLENLDLDISVISSSWPEGNKQYNHIEAKTSGITRKGKAKSFYRNVQSVLKKNTFDIVQSHERIVGCDIYRAGDGVHREWLNIKAKTSNKIANLATKYDGFHQFILGCEKEMFESQALQRVICISTLVKENIANHFDIAEQKLVTITNGIDCSRYQPSDDKQISKQEAGFYPNDRIVLYVGSGFERKGVSDLIMAAKLLPKHYHVVIVGHDKKLKHYQQQATQIKSGAKITFLGRRNDVAKLMQASDLLVHAAHYEPFGNVVLEAMASGIGVITSTQTGAKDLVDVGENGYICETYSAESIADNILKFDNDSDVFKLGQAARIKAEQQTISSMITDMQALYTSLV